MHMSACVSVHMCACVCGLIANFLLGGTRRWRCAPLCSVPGGQVVCSGALCAVLAVPFIPVVSQEGTLWPATAAE